MEILTLISLGLSIYALIKINKIESIYNPKIRTSSSIPSEKITQTKPELKESIQATVPVSEPSGIEKLWKWYVHEWPLKTGALFILLGFIWLVVYAFLNNWIGPVGRITVGMISGILILYGGDRRIRLSVSQGITLVGLGAAIMIVSTYAGRTLYEMYSPLVALSLISLTMILTAAISLKHNQISLAIASLIIGGVAPLLIGSDEKSIVGLYGYLLAITIGVIWMVRYSHWKIILLINLIIVTAYSLGYFFTSASYNYSTLVPQDIFWLQFFAITFISLFFLSTLISIVHNKKATALDLQSAVAVGLFTLGWINGLVPTDSKSLVTVVAAVLYAFSSYGVFIQTRLKEPVFAYSTVAMLLLAVATGQAFDGPTLIIAFSMQALLLPIVGVSLFGWEIGRYMFLYFLLPFAASLPLLDSYAWQQGVFHNDFYALTMVTLSFLVSGLYFYNREKENKSQLHSISLFLIIMGSLYGLFWIWRVFHASFAEKYIGRMFTLLSYTSIGLWAYLTGEIQKRKILYRFGIGLLIFVVGRLLIVEIWDMELTTRIIMFFIIGILFIASVLLRKKTNTT